MPTGGSPLSLAIGLALATQTGATGEHGEQPGPPVIPAMPVASASDYPAVFADPFATCPRPLKQAARVIQQDGGDWQIDYTFQNTGPDRLSIAPSECRASLSSWVANSRSPGPAHKAPHGTPRYVEHTMTGEPPALAGEAPKQIHTADIIASSSDMERCRERAILTVSVTPFAALAIIPTTTSASVARNTDPEPIRELAIEPGGLLYVRIRMEHHHAIYGDYDPLLGTRPLSLSLGGQTIRDVLPLDREQRIAYPTDVWPEVPENMRDATRYVSPPDSLYLQGNVAGESYHRFGERKVRYGSRVRLTFWYWAAPGGDAEFWVRVAQYAEFPNAWRVLDGGTSDELLADGTRKTQRLTGRWVKYERVIRVSSEATTLGLDFRLTPTDSPGEVWVDDVRLEHVGGASNNP